MGLNLSFLPFLLVEVALVGLAFLGRRLSLGLGLSTERGEIALQHGQSLLESGGGEGGAGGLNAQALVFP